MGCGRVCRWRMRGWRRGRGGEGNGRGRGAVSGGCLSLAEREEIAVGLAAGDSLRQIAAGLGRPPSTVSREVARNGTRQGYRAVAAQAQAEARAARPKTARLAGNDRLREWVQARLSERWSPEQVSVMLKAEFPDDREMRVSHEAIYQSIYVQGRGALRRELAVCLRTGRALRRPRRRADERRGRIKDMVMISERPAEADDRAVPGHWEGDLILGVQSSAIGTLVERTTRFTMLLHLPPMDGHGPGARVKNGPALAGHGAGAVREAITRTITTLPEQLRRSLTWDQGAELSQHAQLRIETGVQIYFCDPHSPWQRGTNENTNGLLRQYFPKGTDLSMHSVDTLAAVAAALNGRPRKTLGWRTPAEALDELMKSAHTAVATTG